MLRKKDNKLLKILWNTLKFITYFVILLVIIIIFTQRIFNNKISFFGYRIFTVVTGSMKPEYGISDMLLAKEVDPSTIKVGDDLVYSGRGGDLEGKIITHRVIRLEPAEKGYAFTTKGTANSLDDPKITDDQIIGKIVYRSFFLSLINKVINNPIGFYLLIIIPIAILVVLEIIDHHNDKELEESELMNEE